MVTPQDIGTYCYYVAKYDFHGVASTCYNHRKSRNKFFKIPPYRIREHTQVMPLVNDPRRSFTWLDAKKDESPRGSIAVGPAPE